MSFSPIPQTDPKAGYLAYRTEIDAAVHRVLESGWYILGREVESFEQEFAAYVNVAYGIGVGNGTDALELSLRSCGVGTEDIVFTVSNTAVATVAAIERTGAKPVFVDIDPDTYTMDPIFLEDAIKGQNPSRTKAVIPVHLFGHPANMPAILEVAQKFGLFVVEDCAQSHGALLENRMTGTWGDVAAFSFYPTKNLGALGDGGMVVTNNRELAEMVRLQRQYGWKRRYVSVISGGNSRLDELQAAVLRVKLRYLDPDNEARQKIAEIYHQSLDGKKICKPIVSQGCKHVYHQFVIRSPHRDQLRQYLGQHNVSTGIHYPQPIHLQPAYRRLLSRSELPVTEKIAREILSLPMYPQLQASHVDRVTELISAWAETRK